MPHDHPGFDYWDVNDAAHPFPVGDIDLGYAFEDSAKATAEFTLPPTLPKPQTVAERSIGIAHSAQLSFALECTADAQGNVTCEAVLRGRHVHFFPEHGESETGAVQEIRLSMADLRGGGSREAFVAHGPHCDLFGVTWWQRPGKIGCELVVMHFRKTIQQFFEMRERNNREAEQVPPRSSPYIPLPRPHDPKPKPKPEPVPNVSVDPEKTGIVAWFLGLIRKLLDAIFNREPS